MKTRRRLIVLLLFIVNFTYSQIIQIHGELSDSSLKAPIPYCGIMLKNQNDSIIAGVLTNEKGEFIFKNINYKRGMYLQTKYIGYTDRKVYFLYSSDINVNVGVVFIQQFANQLKEVMVENKINYIEAKFDRKVFSISSNKTAAARTILDLLRTLPGVIVDDEGTVRFKGAEATIYVDDQLSKYIYPKIEMIPVEKVDKIELIDAAMRTGGDGRGGIINIRLKALNPDGLSGMVSANISTITFENIDKSNEFINLNYKKRKITYFINSSFESIIRSTNTLSKTDIYTFEIPSIQNTDTYDIYNRKVNYNYIGAIYNPSQYTRFYLSYGFFNSINNSEFTSMFTEYDKTNQETINAFTNNINDKNNQTYNGITLSYWHKLDTLDSYVKMYCHFNMYNGVSEPNSFYNYSIISSNSVDSIDNYSNKRNFYSKTLYFNLFYNNSISARTRWNLSYNLSLGIQDSLANKHYIFDKLYLSQSQFSNDFNQQHDLSFRIGTQLKKWKIDGGINLSDLYINGSYLRYNSNEEDTVIFLKKNYFKILPSATIAFSINDKSEIKLSLSKTTSLPYFLQLSDYIDKRNLYSWSSGNSDLKPVDFYSIYLGYTYNKENLNVSAECFFNYTSNEVADISIPLTSLLVLIQPENISKTSNTGIDLSVWYKINSNLNFSLSSSIFYAYYNTKSLENTAEYYNLPVGDFIKRQLGYNVKYSMEYKLRKIFAMFYVNYYAKELTFDGYNKAFINSSLNLSRKFNNNKLRITIGLNNIFNDIVEHGSYSDNFGVINNTKITGSKYQRNFSFSIQYNFRQGDRGTKDYK
jgi:hypothetical protein